MLKNKIFTLAVIAAMVLSGSAFVSLKETTIGKTDIYNQERIAEHGAGTMLYGTMLEAGESLLPVGVGLKVQVPVQTAISTALAQFSGAKWVKVSLIFRGNTPFYAILLTNGSLVEVNAISGKLEDAEYAATYVPSRILGRFTPEMFR
jgi:hypothetical protein